MPYQSRHAGTLADLLLRQGDLAAQKAERSGQMWGNVARGVASIPAGIQQRKMAEQAAAMDAGERVARIRASEATTRNAEDAITHRGYEREQDDETRRLAETTQKVSAWLSDIATAPDRESQAMAYQTGRQALVSEGRLTAQDAPEFFPGASWVKSRMSQLLPVAERFKAMFPEPKAPSLDQVDPAKDLYVNGVLSKAGVPAPVNKPAPTPTSLALEAAGGDPLKALALIRSQNASQAQPDYEWVTRNGSPIQIRKGTAQPGDVPYKAPESTSETAQDRQRKGRLDSARGFLERLNELRTKINTNMGPRAGLTGMARQAAGAVGLDPDVAEYERIRAAGGRALAVAIMGAQNLSDADASAWSNMLPGARIDEVTAKRLTDQIGEMLEDTDTGPRKDGPVVVHKRPFVVTAPDGSRHDFATQAEADTFKSLAGIK